MGVQQNVFCCIFYLAELHNEPVVVLGSLTQVLICFSPVVGLPLAEVKTVGVPLAVVNTVTLLLIFLQHSYSFEPVCEHVLWFSFVTVGVPLAVVNTVTLMLLFLQHSYSFELVCEHVLVVPQLFSFVLHVSVFVWIECLACQDK